MRRPVPRPSMPSSAAARRPEASALAPMRASTRPAPTGRRCTYSGARRRAAIADRSSAATASTALSAAELPRDRSFVPVPGDVAVVDDRFRRTRSTAARRVERGPLRSSTVRARRAHRSRCGRDAPSAPSSFARAARRHEHASTWSSSPASRGRAGEADRAHRGAGRYVVERSGTRCRIATSTFRGAKRRYRSTSDRTSTSCIQHPDADRARGAAAIPTAGRRTDEAATSERYLQRARPTTPDETT